MKSQPDRRKANRRRWQRFTLFTLLLLGYLAVLGSGVVIWIQGQPQWGLTMATAHPQPCPTNGQVACIAQWQIASAVGTEPNSHAITAGMYVCAIDGVPITPATSLQAVETAHHLVLSASPACIATVAADLSGDITSGVGAIVDWSIAFVCGILALLLALYTARRALVAHAVIVLTLIFVAFAWLPASTNAPLISESEIAAASYLAPALLGIFLWRLLFPTQHISFLRRALFALIIGLALGFAVSLIGSFLAHADQIYLLNRSLGIFFVVAMYLMVLLLVVLGNIIQREPRQRDAARILGAGAAIALVPVFVFGILPHVIPVTLIIDGSTAASSVIALPLALAYVVLRQDLLGVDTRIRVTTERALGVLGVALVAVIVLSVSAVLFQLPVPIIAFIALPTIMIGILAPTIFYGMRTFTEAWIFPEMGRYRRLIRNARTGGLLDEHETAEALIGEITFALPVHHTTLLVRHDEVGLFEVVGGLEIPPVTVDHPILAAFTNRSMAVVREDLAAYQPLPFQAPPGAHWECFVPIALENRLVGLLLLGPRDDDIGYSTTDRTQLFRLANQRAVALDYLRVLSALRASLEEQKRIDALKDQFIMTAHHELRTPLTSMMGYIDIVARMGSDAWQKEPEDVELMVGEALRSGEDLVHLLDTLLAADRASVRSPDLHPAYIALGEMLRRLATDVEMAGPGQADRISVACPPELVAYADREAFGQVIINLLSNAVKYSPAGAPIEIAAWRRADAPLVEIAVRDYGDGVPPDQQSAIFEKFIRLERDLNSPIRGTGLGLAIVRDRVQAMGGKVWVESTGIPGEGATFHVTLPASPAEAMAAATDPALPVAVTASPTAPAATPKAEAVDELTDTLPRHKLVRYGPPLDER